MFVNAVYCSTSSRLCKNSKKFVIHTGIPHTAVFQTHQMLSDTICVRKKERTNTLLQLLCVFTDYHVLCSRGDGTHSGGSWDVFFNLQHHPQLLTH